MSGKYVRTENVDFLGNEYVIVNCPQCNIKFEVMSIDKVNKTCPPCANPEMEESEKECD